MPRSILDTVFEVGGAVQGVAPLALATTVGNGVRAFGEQCKEDMRSGIVGTMQYWYQLLTAVCDFDRVRIQRPEGSAGPGTPDLVCLHHGALLRHSLVKHTWLLHGHSKV